MRGHAQEGNVLRRHYGSVSRNDPGTEPPMRAVTAEPIVHVFSRSGNAQKLDFLRIFHLLLRESCTGLLLACWLPPRLGKNGIWRHVHPTVVAMLYAQHGAAETAFSYRQFLCTFAPSATRALVYQKPLKPSAGSRVTCAFYAMFRCLKLSHSH